MCVWGGGYYNRFDCYAKQFYDVRTYKLSQEQLRCRTATSQSYFRGKRVSENSKEQVGLFPEIDTILPKYLNGIHCYVTLY